MIDNAILDGFKEIDDSENLSQLVRSNAPQYWQYMKDRADRNCLRRYLPFEGIVAGDPHMGNFGILPLRAGTGARQMKYVNIDFDDAGRGRFVLDSFITWSLPRRSAATSKYVTCRMPICRGSPAGKSSPPKS